MLKRPTIRAAGAAVVAAMSAFAMPAAAADCAIAGAGSVRLLGNDFPATDAIGSELRNCASGDVEVTVNLTTEHKTIQVPALTVNPAQYSAVLIANNSIVPLLNDGLIRPLDDLVAKYGQGLAPNQLIKVNGEVVAIAFSANSQHLFMRGDVLEQAGLEPPKTYEDILTAAQVIRDKGLMQNPLAATDQAGWYLATVFVNIYLGMGGAFFEPGSATPAINNDQGLAALDLMKKMTGYMGPDFLTYSADELNKLYNGGQVAIMNQWGSVVNGVVGAQAPNREIAEATILAAAPTVAGGTIPAAALWWDGFSIARNISDADAEASFQAMVYAIRPEMTQEHADIATWLSKGFQVPEAAKGVMDTAMGGARTYPMSPYMGLLHTALGTELPAFLQGTESAEEALRDVEASYTSAAREAGFMQ